MKAAEMKKGLTILFDGRLYIIIDFEHVKCGKGGAIYQTKLKSIADGLINNARIRSEENIEEAHLDKRKFEYLYSEPNGHIVMDLETYDQITLDDDAFGDGKKYLKPNTALAVSTYQGKLVSIDLPNSVDLAVTQTPPEIKGATASGQKKSATLETGAVVNVPSFIKIGEVIRVDTRTGEYLTRA
ncbi:MAG: elongation factor P [Planctomycetes bacterium]|nr:elongation factor P [Planctomycetota bacterium]MBU1517749.1 elongation factor P [Planctomycetota bacterium]MBU2457835.1 elongation factor P [Planctomycetota bacterium]MBU2596554.1 elongation factor P [Planctomycetota bacterium]